MRPLAKTYIALVVAFGLMILAIEVLEWEAGSSLRFPAFLAIASVASGLKVRLPGITGATSVYFLFLTAGIVHLPVYEVVIFGVLTTLLHCFWQAGRRPKPVQVVFNLAGCAITAYSTFQAYHWTLFDGAGLAPVSRLCAAAFTYFVINTGSIALAIALTEGKSARQVWRECYFWCFPYYLAGACLVGLAEHATRRLGWPLTLLAAPAAYAIYRSYWLYVWRLEDEKCHAEQAAALHLRTIEALALAIDAKDHTSHDHLRRVQTYAMEIARELRLSKSELDGLQAAALLRDIGKLAVPEHIVSKPGKLTPEEFEKMKIHPLVGAEILERVKFPCPVAPIVLAHHERWDGSGYPFGLKGEQIPAGARILAAVDCLDALATDRQYRRALPLQDALATVVAESGTSFDPRVVEILQRRCMELERLYRRDLRAMEPVVSSHSRIEKGDTHGEEFERPCSQAESRTRAAFLQSIAEARQEAQALYELAQTLGNSLSLNDTISVMAGRLGKLVACDCLAVYIVREGRLNPEYVVGEDSRLFCSLRIPMGEGLSGWVAANRKPIINGNPCVERGYLNNPRIVTRLSSAIVVPLEGTSGVVGVLALYHRERDAFSRDQLRVLLAISSKLSIAIENAFKYEQAASSATTDYLTSLPNARSLFMHLDGEVARCQRKGGKFAVLVCDLDGFKRVNDHFGHLAGNKVLTLVAARLRERCREYDYVARMGGDEFVLILPDLSPDDARRKIEELNQVAGEAGRTVCGEDIVSLSAGEAFYPADGQDAEGLLAEADRRMYKSKNTSRKASDHRLESEASGAGRYAAIS